MSISQTHSEHVIANFNNPLSAWPQIPTTTKLNNCRIPQGRNLTSLSVTYSTKHFVMETICQNFLSAASMEHGDPCDRNWHVWPNVNDAKYVKAHSSLVIDRLRLKWGSDCDKNQRQHHLRVTDLQSNCCDVTTHLNLVPHICVSESDQHWFS